jgi:hypothetical protein
MYPKNIGQPLEKSEKSQKIAQSTAFPQLNMILKELKLFYEWFEQENFFNIVRNLSKSCELGEKCSNLVLICYFCQHPCKANLQMMLRLPLPFTDLQSIRWRYYTCYLTTLLGVPDSKIQFIDQFFSRY